jgi:hypothetical protein
MSRVQNVRVLYGDHPTFYSVKTGESFHGVNVPETESVHSSISSAEFMNKWSLFTELYLVPSL